MRREGDLDAESPVSDAGMSEIVKRVNELASKLHLDNIEIVTDTSMLEGKKKNAKGFYNRKTGKISIVVANHNDLADLEKTVLHESVAHHGLRKLFGEHFNAFLDNVFIYADADVRKRVTELAAKHGWNFRTATEEYLAGLAEDTDFENAKKTGWWEKVKRAFLDMLHKIAFDEYDGDVLTDNELRYILWRSYSNLKENGEHNIINAARNEVMKQKLLANDKPKTAAEKALDAIRQRVMELFEQAGSGEFTGKPKSIGRLSGEGKALLEKLSGQRFKEFVDFMLNPSDLNHIRGDHYGENEKDKGNNIPLTDEDIMNLVDVINQPDGILYGIDKKDGRKLFFFLKDAGNGLYNLTEVCSTKKGNITGKSFFKTKKKGINQRVMEITDSLLPTSVTYSGEFLSSGAKLSNKEFRISDPIHPECLLVPQYT